ncbi:MAG: Wadjet anti-phage system protein JetD domain-containing protein [Sphingomonas sp.]|jgi:hypothetical protein|uniref:Wadjet anti-phage system protein JetD domain-containing protein n=1 Tax=Sphingomonas sp. TaxID=28214 RepID=UPI003566092D
MKRHGDPGTLLRRLLERHERRTDDRHLIERPTQVFDGTEDRRALNDVLAAAEVAGAVRLFWDRDAPHLIERVLLLDAELLSRFTGHVPRSLTVEAGVAALTASGATTDMARRLVSDLTDAWRSNRKVAGLGPERPDAALALVLATEAAFTPLPPGVPLRTRSARLLGDSKALERSLAPLLTYLRLIGAVDPQLSRDEALGHLGLSKFPQPVLAAGAFSIGGAAMAGWPFVGIPPELIDTVEPAGRVKSLLTIENLESFNRHVREARHGGDIVVYTGGFPAPTVVSLLAHLVGLAGVERLHHWGDIDPGGLRIALFLESALSLSVVPHLMDPDLAELRGSTPSSRQQVPPATPLSGFCRLATYLAGEDARWLEQEMTDPEPVG